MPMWISKPSKPKVYCTRRSAFNPDDEDDIIIKAANKFDKKLNYDLEEVLPDEGVDYDNLDVKYPDLVKTVVELGE